MSLHCYLILISHIHFSECSTNEPSCSSTCNNEKCRYCENSAGICTGCIPGYHGYQCQLGMSRIASTKSKTYDID